MRSDIIRRDVAWNAATATLTVGGRTTVVTCEPGDNECLLRTYLGLVAEQREVTLGRGVELRRDDIAVLAELLDLEDVDLEARLRRMLHLSDQEAADLHRRLRRQRMAAAALGVGLLAGVPVGTGAAAAADAVGGPVRLTPVVATAEAGSEAVSAADPVTVAANPAPKPAPEPEGEVEIGHAVRHERDPDFVAPDGVDIGDAMVIERDPEG